MSQSMPVCRFGEEEEEEEENKTDKKRCHCKRATRPFLPPSFPLNVLLGRSTQAWKGSRIETLEVCLLAS